ncbi:MAG: tyrosine-protein phosphatase [Anaerolineae bacterium]|nr:tyrosine-protein phosphatase [Anaerolineae bacterium]
MRHIALNHAHNFRDLGGYPTSDGGQTRQGVVYRADALCRLDDADRQTLAALGLCAVFDLRDEREVRDDGPDQLGDGVRVIALPTNLVNRQMFQQLMLRPNRFRMSQLYTGNFTERATYHATLFRHLLDPANRPAVIHCTAGKDRTGIAVALLLRLAGVADKDILADYAATARYMDPIAAAQRAKMRRLPLQLHEAVLAEMLSAREETLQILLDHLDERFGSVEAYLAQGGLTSAEIDDLQACLVEPASEAGHLLL